MPSHKKQLIQKYDMLMGIADKRARTEQDPELAQAFDTIANAYGYLIRYLENRL